MKIHASGEDYLEAILVLQKKMGMVRSIDLARHMGFSKPSISHAVGVLKNGGFLTVDDDGFLHLTVIGREIAEKIYERHLFFMEQFIAAGVDQETAEQDACRIEHAISDTSFRKLKEKVQGTDQLKSAPFCIISYLPRPGKEKNRLTGADNFVHSFYDFIPYRRF